MKRRTIQAATAVAMVMGLANATFAATCLTNGADAVGNAAFGATVQTFINLGINPNNTCIENVGWTDPSGFALGSYVKGAEGLGGTPNPAVLGFNGATVNGTFAGNANARDFFWVQDTSPNANLNGVVGSGPSTGIVWDLGGQANKAVVFVQVDHGPVPGEVLENTAWLSNDPNAANAGWTQAVLEHVYGGGWSPDPNISDGFVAVYSLPNNATFRFVSVTWGGPAAIVRDGDNEIDAVGGLTASGCGVQDPRPECNPTTGVPEPSALLLLGLGLAVAGTWRRRLSLPVR
jgi:PEP-CTERM motif